MALDKHDTVDVVAYDPTKDRIVLGMLGLGCWGEDGAKMFELMVKMKTYLAYALEGHLEEDYPELACKKVVIRLYHTHELGREEAQLVNAIRCDYLEPAGINWEQCNLPDKVDVG